MIFIYVIGCLVSYCIWFYLETRDVYWTEHGFLNIIGWTFVWPIGLLLAGYYYWKLVTGRAERDRLCEKSLREVETSLDNDP